jgi:hypothetical protein
MQSPILRCALMGAHLLTLAGLRAIVTKLTAAVCLAFVFISSVSAGDFTARIKSILLYEDGELVYVYPEGGVQSPPACHGSNGDYTSFKMSRPRAREYLAALLAAQMAGKSVHFRTAGVCTDQSMSDTLLYFRVDS